MQVLIVNPGIYVYGGAELVIVKLANYMTKRGVENALLTTSILPEMERDLDGTEIIIQKKKKFPIEFSGSSELFSLNRGVASKLNDFDVINVHNYPAEFSTFPYHKPTIWMCNEPALYLSFKIRSSPLSKLMKGSLLSFDKFVVKYFVRHAVVADKFNAKRFQEIYGFWPKIVNYGIDYEFFSKGDERKGLEKFGLFDNFIVLHVGILNSFKNQMESIKTIEKLRSRIPNIKLILAGREESEKPILERYVKDKGLEQNVIFTGHLNRDIIRDLYHSCHVLLHPIKPQGGWLAPFEALCARKPIVVSSEMTASDIIRREGIGIVTDDYAISVLDIYKNPDKYNEMAKTGEEWVKRNLNWERFCEKMTDLFYETMQKARYQRLARTEKS